MESFRGGHGSDRPGDEVLCQHPANFHDGGRLAAGEAALQDGEVLEREGRQERVDRLLQVLVPNLIKRGSLLHWLILQNILISKAIPSFSYVFIIVITNCFQEQN